MGLDLVKRTANDKFAGVKVSAVGFARFVNWKDCRVLDVRVRARRVEKFLRPRRILAQATAQDMECDWAPDRDLFGPVEPVPKTFGQLRTNLIQTDLLARQIGLRRQKRGGHFRLEPGAGEKSLLFPLAHHSLDERDIPPD